MYTMKDVEIEDRFGSGVDEVIINNKYRNSIHSARHNDFMLEDYMVIRKELKIINGFGKCMRKGLYIGDVL